MNPTRNHEVAGSILGLDQWVGDLALPWLWCRLAATAPIRLLAWEPPYATSAALKRQKKKKGHRLKKNCGNDGRVKDQGSLEAIFVGLSLLRVTCGKRGRGPRVLV